MTDTTPKLDADNTPKLDADTNQMDEDTRQAIEEFNTAMIRINNIKRSIAEQNVIYTDLGPGQGLIERIRPPLDDTGNASKPPGQKK